MFCCLFNILLYTLWYLLLAVLLLLLVCRLYIKGTVKWNKSYTCLVGKTCIVTGANTGIGYWTAMDFAKRGASVILACRVKETGEAARERIIRATKNDKVYFKQLELHSLKSVKKFCEEMNQMENIHILVNNAALAGDKSRLTEDGFDQTWQINYLSPFLLTNLLLPKIKASAPSRIVNVASVAAKQADLTPADIGKFPKTFKGEMRNIARLYSWTKQANILFTIYLADKLRGINVNVYALHPGVILTDIWRKMPKWMLAVTHLFLKLTCKTAEEGAQTTIYCAVSQECDNSSGKLYTECGEVEMYKNCDDFKLVEDVRVATEKLLKDHLH